MGWRPNPGQQALAYHCPADILFYGGAAGGGKTDLVLGLAANEHRRSIIFRRVYPSLSAIIDRSRQIYASDADSSVANRFNESRHRWRFADGRSVRFGSLQHDHSVTDFQGQAHDFYAFDELPEFTESQFRFVTGWNRTTVPGQRCRVVCTGNPPTDSEGEWVVRYFAPWLDENHPRPAKEGELRWFTTIKGEDVELPSGDPIEVDGFKVRPLSRTFIHARLEDNPHQDNDYRARLQALPEPLRSKMLFGDFKAGREDSAYQVIPSEWVRLAQARWKPREKPGPMSALGVDVARGGKDKTILSPRHGNWLAQQKAYPGSSTPDGAAVAALVLTVRTDDAVVNIDVIGVGSSPYDHTRAAIGGKAVAMNASEASEKRDRSGKLGFVNQRAEWWWSMREALDPTSGQDLALPPDPELKADLCAPKWKLTPRGIQVEAKDELIKRLGRSPDKGDSAVYAVAIKVVAGQGLLDLAAEAMAAKNSEEKKPWQR